MLCSIEVSCGDIPVVENGKVSGSGTAADNLYQAQHFVTCNDGFSLIGSNTFACQADKTWSAVPSCLGK